MRLLQLCSACAGGRQPADKPGQRRRCHQCDLCSAPARISGTVTDSRWTAQVLANRAVFNVKKNPASQFLGAYTLDIPGDASTSGKPSGDGFATVKVDAGGNVQVAGSLAEGSKLSLKAAL